MVKKFAALVAVIALISFVPVKSAAYDFWIDVTPIIERGKEYVIPIWVLPLEGEKQYLVISVEHYYENITYYTPLVSDGDGNIFVPVCWDGIKPYIPLLREGEALKAGIYVMIEVYAIESGLIYMKLDGGANSGIELSAPTQNYPEGTDGYVLPLIDDYNGYAFVIPLVIQIMTPFGNVNINPWDIGHDELLPFSYEVGFDEPL